MFMENLPFPRGSTFYGNGTPNLTDVGAIALEGKEYLVQDSNVGDGTVVLRVVRNVSGTALAAKRLVRFQSGYEGRRVDGYGAVQNQWTYPVDDAYGSQTIANNDLFYVVVRGPCLINSSLAGADTNWSVGDYVACCTAATSQATTAGRLAQGTCAITGNTGPGIMKDIRNQIGRALTAATTNNTNTDTLVDVGWLW